MEPPGACTVLGPLPKLYRLVVSLVAVLLFVGSGAWAAYVLPYPFLVGAGAGVGLAIGVICAYLLLHVAEQPRSPHDARQRRLR